MRFMRWSLLLIALVILGSLVQFYRPSEAVIVLPGPRVTEVERLQALANELKDRDYLRRVEVRSGSGWGFLDLDDTTKSWMTYDRRSHFLQDHIMGGNCNGEWKDVTEQALLSVAHTKGELAALAAHGARNVCP
jgi:hypothetical protein